MEEHVVSLSEASVIIICLDGFWNYDWNGRVYVRSREEAAAFCGTLELLELMEANYDSLDYPQASMNNRHFSLDASGKVMKKAGRVERVHKADRGERTVALSRTEMEEKRGKQATFLVRVQYRQQATWQGQITWMEKNKTASFRSALELLKLIDSVESGKESWWE